MKARTCEFSPDRTYRYTLWREWGYVLEGDRPDRSSEYLMVVGLNPSTADETRDDPTIRRCINFAKNFGFGALCMTNLYGFRATDPRVMKKAGDRVGAMNDYWLKICAKDAGMILAAWGRHAEPARVNYVRKILPGMHCLEINKDGTPKHPLFVPNGTQPLEYL